jgi:hypothetical protein
LRPCRSPGTDRAGQAPWATQALQAPQSLGSGQATWAGRAGLAFGSRRAHEPASARRTRRASRAGGTSRPGGAARASVTLLALRPGGSLHDPATDAHDPCGTGWSSGPWRPLWSGGTLLALWPRWA